MKWIMLIGFVGFLTLLGGERVIAPVFHSVISTAEAVVGRPMTPVSGAGVARRTVRRCAAGVYSC
jgi:hypothetical protein